MNELLRKLKRTFVEGGGSEDDQTVLHLAHAILTGNYPMDNKMDALAILDRAMKTPRLQPISVDDVREYIKAVNEVENDPLD